MWAIAQLLILSLHLFFLFPFAIASVPLVAIPALRDGSWSSAYGCVGDDWGEHTAELTVYYGHTHRAGQNQKADFLQETAAFG